MVAFLTMERAVKIIGHGAVVKQFLAEASQIFPGSRFQVFCRKPAQPVEDTDVVQFFELEGYCAQESDITLLCISANETEILQQHHAEGRLRVAKANVAIVSSLIARGFFTRGTVFVVTNPSEIIAEYVYRKTANKNVFALGLSNDHRRYQKIFSKLGVSADHLHEFKIGGNHWDYPVPLLDSGSELYRELLKAPKLESVLPNMLVLSLYSLLKQEISTEFSGFKPPVKSGVQAMQDIVAAILDKHGVMVSGIDADEKNFVAGVLLCKPSHQHVFTEEKFHHVPDVVSQVYERHRLALSQFLNSR